MKNKSIKRRLLFFTLSLLLLSSVVNSVLGVWIVGKNSKDVLIEKANEQVYEIAKQAETILNSENDPIPSLQDFVESKAQQENVTYAIVIDTNVKAVAHSDKGKLGKTYEDAYTIDGAKHGKKQFTRWYAEVQDIWTYDIMEPIYKDGELYGVIDIGVPESGIQSITNSVLGYQIVTGIVSFIIIGALMWWIIGRIVAAIKNLEKVIHQTASLDFTENPELDKLLNHQDEIGLMAKGISSMRSALKNVTVNIHNTSSELSESSNILIQIAEDTVRTTDEISSAINEMAKATEEQAHDTEKSAEQLNQLSGNIDRVIEHTEKIASMTEDIGHLSNQGVGTVNQLSVWSEKNRESSQQVSNIVQEVDKTSSDISSIVNTITDIATQTNLLALNASIESARVGEAGKGFAVVADEIRKLSEQTSNATEDIKNKISAIQDISKSAVQEISTSLSIVEQNAKATKDTSEIFHTIKVALDQTSEVAQEVKHLSHEMDERKEQIISAVQNISASAVETSAGTEQVSASANEQLKSIETVSGKAKDLNAIADALRDEMKKFTI
ncbi:methyl-accepting chemotaxis protein [Lysinibacillus xylanilyticus]|uniref:methyl-accepting chemotaxis protein n=1 Tax=Lysinibacillus xylanilyticus TaxID=582475 RepID=UPI002B23FC64|nr:methyl-accepting chemotaxis protein [Lysinibacillus xylanilyticus]MEB2281827.1 methyl-accepting chemotaxis protein [Lysinibacillus xylanilyticus]